MSKPSLKSVGSVVAPSLPTSIAQVGTITKYELLNYFRSRRFFVLLIIGIVISAIFTAVVGYYGIAYLNLTSALGFYSFWWGNSITLVVILSGIFFGGDAISGEFQNKTGYFLVGNPLRRSSIYIGKWIAALTASLIIFAIYAAIAVGNGIYYFGANIPYQYGESLIFSVLYLIAVLGFTFFLSPRLKTTQFWFFVPVFSFFLPSS